jgi:hypothetical protein
MIQGLPFLDWQHEIITFGFVGPSVGFDSKPVG